MSLHCSIVTPEKELFDAEAEKITVPAHDGEIGILPRHARLLAKLGVGVLRVTTTEGTTEMFIEGGFVQVADDRVTVLTDSASELGEIDVEAAAQRVAELRGSGHGEEFASAKHRHLTMKRVKERGDRS